MRITRRLVISLIIVVASVAFLAASLRVRQEARARSRDLERRARVLCEGLEGAAEHLVERGDRKNLDHLVQTIGDGGVMSGAAVFDAKGSLLAVTPGLSPGVRGAPGHADEALRKGVDSSGFDLIGDRLMDVYARALLVWGA